MFQYATGYPGRIYDVTRSAVTAAFIDDGKACESPVKNDREIRVVNTHGLP